MIAKGSTDAASRLLLLGCTACAIALIPLAFQPWLNVHFTGFFEGSGMVGGDEHSGLTGLGDGWAVGVVSAAVTLPAIVSLALRRWQPIAGLAFAVAGLAILAIAGYDVNHDWNARYTGWNANATDVDVMPALWATIALGLALCLGGLALRALRKRETSANQLATAGLL